MQKTEGFHCIWYKCPECDTENTLRTNFEHPLHLQNFKCIKCKHIWTMELLHKTIASGCKSPLPPRDKFNAMATEFICDSCGRTNLVFSKIIEETDRFVHEEGEEWKGDGIRCHMTCAEPPKEVVCQFCQTSFKIVFPIPQAIKDAIMEQMREDGVEPDETIWDDEDVDGN